MNKFKESLISICKCLIMMLSFVALSVSADSKYYDTTKMTILKVLGEGFYQSQYHKCHLNTVYFVEAGNVSHSSIVWNHSTSSPLKCTEYASYMELTRKEFLSNHQYSEGLSKDELLSRRTGQSIDKIKEARQRKIDQGLIIMPGAE